MAAESDKYEVVIGADGKQALRVIGDVADKADKLDGTEAEIDLDANDKDAKRKILDIDQLAEKLSDEDYELVLKAEVRNAERAIERLNRQLSKARDEDDIDFILNARDNASTHLDDVNRRYDALQAEKAVNLDVNVDTHDSARRIREVGDNTRSASDTMQSGIGPLRGFTDEMGSSAGMAGIAANALIDAGEAVEIFGAKLGISGDKLRKWSGILAGIGVAGAGVFLAVNEALGRQRERAQNATDEMEKYTEALLDGESAAGRFVAQLRETGKLELRDWSGDMSDIADELHRSGISAQQFGEAVDGGVPAMNRLLDAAKAAGASEKDLLEIRQVAAGTLKDYQGATERAAQVTELIAGSEEEAARQTEVHAEALEDVADAQEEARDRTQEFTEALNEQIDSMVTAADAAIAVEDAQQDFITAVAKSNAVQADASATTEDKTDAVNAERNAMRDAANAAVGLAQSEAAAAGKTLTATQRVDTFNTSLLSNARYATPAARKAIYDYVIQANDIPEDKATKIRALIEQGKLDEAERLINQTSRRRDAAIVADASGPAEGELNHWARDRWSTINVKLRKDGGITWSGAGNQLMSIYGTGVQHANPGKAIVGEHGPEIVELEGGEKITPAHRTNELLRSSSSASQTFNYVNHIYMPPGANPRDIKNAIDRHNRRNGR